MRTVPLVGLVVMMALGACADGDDDATPEPVAECAGLRDRENELIEVANETLAAVGDSEDATERAVLLVNGFGELIDTARAQVDAVESSEPTLEEALRTGARAAVTSLERERDEFSATVPVVTDEDERGRVGQFQNALEKAFSEMEPPRSVYESVGLDEAIDDDPTCEFVTQRADPAG